MHSADQDIPMNPFKKLKNIKETIMKKKRHIAILLTVLIISTTCVADDEILESIKTGDLTHFQAIGGATFNQLPIAQLQQHLRLARAKSSSFHGHAKALEQSGVQWFFSHLTNFFLGSVQEERTQAETKRADLDQIIESLHGKVQAALVLKQRRDTEQAEALEALRRERDTLQAAIDENDDRLSYGLLSPGYDYMSEDEYIPKSEED